MIYIPSLELYLNLDLVRYVYRPENASQPTLYVVFGPGSSSGSDQIAVYGNDVAIVRAALDWRCQKEAGEA